MGSQMRKFVTLGMVMAGIAGLAACGPKAPPPAPPPPPPAPPPVVYIPPRPLPPLGAAASFAVPILNADGTRKTINSGISSPLTIWNFRSAYNVAALNCQKPQHADILIGYKKFLVAHKKGLASAAASADGEFKKRYGTGWIRPREAYSTQVYNYYAFPPTITNFCDAATIMARESMTVKPADLAMFAKRSLAQFDTVFVSFYVAYEQYQADATAWDAKYAPKPAGAPVVAVPAGPST